ncbi:MAG: toprim domain-containing protein [Bacillota bacterium]|nr:toprim domain-containing protein [Bacillota bacterium]
MNAKETYDNQSIQSLKGADRVRKRPSVIFGSDGLEGCEHSFFEILSNSIDEAREGFGKVIEITRFKDKSIQVKDYGRGIPLDFNSKENRYNWELVFCELYAGGKYNNNDSGENYEFSLGLNGLGACATQYSSEYMDVDVSRDGYSYSLHFEKGENVGGLIKIETGSKKTYTIQKWRPDLDVFTAIDISLEFFMDLLKKQAIVNAGLTFVLYDETDEGMQKYEFCYSKGIIDYVDEVANLTAFTQTRYIESERKGRDREDKPLYKLKMQAAFCFSPSVTLLEYYHNSSFLEHGGSPDKATRNAFVYAIDQYIKQTNKYQKNESKITFNDVADCLILVTNSFSTMTSYANQTKKAITNSFIQEAMTDFLRHNLEVYFIENKAEADKIADRVLLNKRSRETAERTRNTLKKKLSASMDVTNKVQKFVDCRVKDPDRRELYIVEGDSALGSCKQGRNSEFQAIIPVRGKILNCLKSDYNKIFNNEIIMDLIRVLGCGIEIKSKFNKEFNTFSIDALNYTKVIICTDADVDGFQIRTLILTMLHRLVPTLISENKVFIAETPLFEITTKEKKPRTFFAYDEKEKSEILNKLEKEECKFGIQRSKGLGENEPEMMWMTTMNPETRRLIKVMPDDAVQTSEIFEMLLGSNLDGRKDYISKNGSLYLDMLDIS